MLDETAEEDVLVQRPVDDVKDEPKTEESMEWTVGENSVGSNESDRPDLI